MAKKFVRFICAALALCLLCGCSAGGLLPGAAERLFNGQSRARAEAPVFDEMEYMRPDVGLLEEHVEKLCAELEKEDNFDAVAELIELCYEDYYSFDTMAAIANIRFCHDISDSFYSAENSWCDENYPLVTKLMDDMYFACGGSEYAERIEEELLWEGFNEEYGEGASSLLTDRVVELMQEESELVNAYYALTADPVIEFKGEEVVLYDYLSRPFLRNDDYEKAMLEYYKQYNDDFAGIYISLINIRNELAAELGYESYELMQYEYTYERDYSPEDAAGYIQDIKTYFVPLAREIYDEGLWYDVYYDYVENDELIKAVSAAAESMGGYAEEAMDFMLSKELSDTSVSSAKAAMSYQTYLNDYECPYIFMDAAGTSYDILTLSHEFGHFLDAYINYNAMETLDMSEACSQSMEYLMLSYYGDALDRDSTEMLFRLKMLDTVDVYLQQAAFTEFERLVYSAEPEELTADFLNSSFLSVWQDYELCAEGDELSCSLFWVDIVHLFEVPFYMISYPVSNDAAMQIYELERDKAGQGLETYMDMLPRDYTGFIETLEASGMESPFAPGRIEKAAEDLRQALGLRKHMAA